MTADTTTGPADAWRRRRTTTFAMCALVLLSAFESLAVTTVMPLVADVLGGHDLYALAFAAPLATGVIGMIVAGPWADRRGPSAPLVTAVALFLLGLLVAGTAGGMPVLVAGRLLQGFGSGAITVALYVMVARLYPPLLQPRLFAMFAAAWVLPSLVGPTAAGLVAQHIGWRWVFLGVAVLVVPTVAALVPALRAVGHGEQPSDHTGSTPGTAGRLTWAFLAAIAVLALDQSGRTTAAWRPVAAAAATAAALVAFARLVPPGTLVARRGLPATIASRGVLSGAFFSAQVYLPLLLTERDGYPPAAAGVALTAASITWATAAWVQGRAGPRLSDRDAVWLGSALVAAGVAGCLAVVVLALPAGVAIGCWALSGAGMGFVYARQLVLVLAQSAPGTQGTGSAALSIADSVGAALALAGTGLAASAARGDVARFAAPFALSLVLALLASAVAPRVAARVREAPGALAPAGQPDA